MRILPLSLLSSALLSCLALPAQTPAAKPATSQPDKYAAESYVVLHSDSIYAMNADGTGYRQRTIAVRVQSEAAVRSLGVIGVPFASASEKVEFTYVHVRRPDGTLIDSPATDAQEQPEPVTREAPFYSDLKQKQLPVKSLRVGDTLEWQVKILRTKAEAPNEFWGQEGFIEDTVALAESVELRVPAAKLVNVWTDSAFAAKPVETTAGDQRIYRWEHTQLKPTAGPDAEAAKKLKAKTPLTPAQERDEREGRLPTIAWTTFKSWEAVGAWYRGLEGTRMQPDDSVKAKVAELTAGKTTEEAKVQAVYAYVSTNVRYIGVALGIGRYQPHHAEEVMENQYGDCKDKHTLLAAMLTALGLRPDAVLIGAQVRFNEAVPSPSAFNHLITHVVVDGKPIWLDSTAEVAPYRMLSQAIRDKQALVIPDSGPARIERTLADPPFDSFATMTAKGTLDAEGISNSRFTLAFRGDMELMLRSVARQVPPAQYDELVQRFMGGMGYGGTVSHADLTRPEDTSTPFTMNFDYKREKGGDWDNLRTISQLFIVSLPRVDEKEPPIQSIDLGWPRTEDSTAEMKLPEAWGVELPEAIHATSPYGTYDLTYRFDKGTLYASRKLVILQQYIPAADWKAYKKWQDAVNPGTEPYVQLTRKGTKNSAKASKPALPSNEEAAKLITQANDLIQQKDPVSAGPLLEQAKTLNPTQRNLWSTLGYMNWALGANNEALTDYRKELELYPSSFWVYESIYRLQIASRKRGDGETTLRQWAAAEPANPAPTRILISLLLYDGKAKAAVEAGQKALAAMPEDKRSDPAFQLQFGKAQLQANMTAEGHATLLAVLNTTDNPAYMNDAAYDLADANLELPLTEKKEREAIEKLTAETRAWTLDETPATLLQRSVLLAESWDTLGWILFRQGKFAESETWLQAAWHYNRHTVNGEHVGDVRMALRDPGGALDAYQLAAANIPNFGGHFRTDVTELEKELTARIDKAKREGGKSNFADQQAAFDQMKTLRRIELGSANGLEGSGQYRILIGWNGVERVLPGEGTSFEGGAERLEKVKLPDFFPTGSTARLVRNVALSCLAGTCVMTLQ